MFAKRVLDNNSLVDRRNGVIVLDKDNEDEDEDGEEEGEH